MERLSLRPDRRARRRGAEHRRPTCRRPTPRAMPNSTCALPELPTTTRPLKANVTVRMREPGGRAVEKNASLPVEAAEAAARHQARGSTRTARRRASRLDVPAHRHRSGRQADRGQGRDMVAEAAHTPPISGSRPTATGATRRSPAPARSPAARSTSAPTSRRRCRRPCRWGEYRLEIAADGFAPASIDFSSGYYYARRQADTPDTLQVALDKTSVKTGETINVKIDARFAGKASAAGRRRPAACIADASMCRRAAPPCRSPSARAGAPAPMCS